MKDKIMNIKVRLTTGRKLHALAEKNGETMVDALDRIIEQEWQNNITNEKPDVANKQGIRGYNVETSHGNDSIYSTYYK